MLIHFTVFSRLPDGLPLVATMDTSEDADVERLKKAVKNVPRRAAAGGDGRLPPWASVSAGDFAVHYASLPGEGAHPAALFLAVCDRSYPRLLAFSYLQELAKAFRSEVGGEEVAAAVRPYAFIRFESAIQATRRRYLNTRSLRTADNLAELSTALQGVPVLRAEDALPEMGPSKSAASRPRLNVSLGFSSVLPGQASVGERQPALLPGRAWTYFMLALGTVVGLVDWWYASLCLDYALSGNALRDLPVGRSSLVHCSLLDPPTLLQDIPEPHLPRLLMPTSLLVLLLWTTPIFYAVDRLRPLPWFLAPSPWAILAYALASLAQSWALTDMPHPSSPADPARGLPRGMLGLKVAVAALLLATVAFGRQPGEPKTPVLPRGMPTPTRQVSGHAHGKKGWFGGLLGGGGGGKGD
ncbi:Longin-like domain-containing protein [Hyaloraphidium curvatum]|nr:Longin-like domain-containing protein [Hyaloraphidium curvatum]